MVAFPQFLSPELHPDSPFNNTSIWGVLSLTIRLIFSLLCSLPRPQCFTLKKHTSRHEPQPGVFATLRACHSLLAMASFKDDLGSHHRAQECEPPTYISLRVTARDYLLVSSTSLSTTAGILGIFLRLVIWVYTAGSPVWTEGGTLFQNPTRGSVALALACRDVHLSLPAPVSFKWRDVSPQYSRASEGATVHGGAVSFLKGVVARPQRCACVPSASGPQPLAVAGPVVSEGRPSDCVGRGMKIQGPQCAFEPSMFMCPAVHISTRNSPRSSSTH